MKIITALKKIKHLDRKIETTEHRLNKWCSFVQIEDEAPLYNETAVNAMIQQIGAWTDEKVRIRHAIHKTNLTTVVEFDGKERSIDELLLMKSVSIPKNIFTLQSLRRREKNYNDPKESVVVTQFNPKLRDQAIERLHHIHEKLDEIIDELSMSVEVIFDDV